MAQKLSQKPAQKVSHSEPYSRIPRSVLNDKRLTASARCVYAFLAGCVHQGTIATVGQRRISAVLGFSRNTVAESIKELAEHEHIEVCRNGKQRHAYHLTSDVFGSKQRAGVEEVISYPRKRLVSSRIA